MNDQPGAPTTLMERQSERVLAVTRRFDAPARLVFRAWADPALFRRWWVPASFGITLVSMEADVRTGGTYQLVMKHPAAPEPMTFFGRYLDVVEDRRIVWTNEEGEGEGAVTTVSFAEEDGHTLVTVEERYPSAEALEEAVASGSTSGWADQFDQLAGLLAAEAG